MLPFGGRTLNLGRFFYSLDLIGLRGPVWGRAPTTFQVALAALTGRCCQWSSVANFRLGFTFWVNLLENKDKMSASAPGLRRGGEDCEYLLSQGPDGQERSVTSAPLYLCLYGFHVSWG